MDMLRHSVFGQLARLVTGGHFLPQRHDVGRLEELLFEFEHPTPNERRSGKSVTDEDSLDSVERGKTEGNEYKLTRTMEGLLLIGWFSSDDPDNPQNWGSVKKYFVGLLIWYERHIQSCDTS